MDLYLTRDEWKCALTELGEQCAMQAEDIIATIGAPMMLLLCAASWDIKRKASLWIAIIRGEPERAPNTRET